ncbi:MAG TPA: hypothetical protein ENJ80_09760 [Gammaproteobacteria bacterium]|nr:hypothetical protein [Gammaproteobacteria bacterium]
MKATTTKALSLVLVVSTLLPACNLNPPRADGGAAPMTASEQKLREEGKSINTSGLQACLISAGAVGTATYLLTGDKGKAIGGAIVACGVGVGANYYLQNKRQQYANGEQRLQAMIEDVRKDNARLSRIIQSAGEVVAEDRQRIDEIDKAYRAKQITLEQAQEKMRSVDDNKAYLEQTLANLRKREEEWKQVAEDERKQQPNSKKMVEMDKEIGKLQEQIASLEEDLNILINRRSVSPIG